MGVAFSQDGNRLASLGQVAYDELLVIYSQWEVTGGAADIAPTVGLERLLEQQTIELAVTQHHDLSLRRNQGQELMQELEMYAFGKMTLAALGHEPDHRKGTTAVDHAEHQGHTAPPDGTAIENQ